MRGRKPKPTEVKRRNGKPGHRALPENEPEPTPGMPAPPDDIADDVRAIWDRVTPELFKMGVLAKVHREIVASYCRAVAEEEWAERVIADEGAIIDTPFGKKANPAVKIRNDAEKRKRQIAVEFGLTPSSQARASKVPQPKDPDSQSENPALRLLKRASSAG